MRWVRVREYLAGGIGMIHTEVGPVIPAVDTHLAPGIPVSISMIMNS
jgi:hypothetical protein